MMRSLSVRCAFFAMMVLLENTAIRKDFSK